MHTRKHFLIQKKYLKNSFGAAHHRALNLVERNEGISINELLIKLKITKQSLNRVLRDLKRSKIIKQVKDQKIQDENYYI